MHESVEFAWFHWFLYLFVLAVISIATSVCLFYRWFDSLYLTECINRMPGIEMKPIITYLVILFTLYKKKAYGILPTCIVLQGACGLCQIFDKERICRQWIGFRPLVVFFKPETVKVLLNSNSAINKAKEYNFLHPWLGTGLITSTGDKWRTRRKLLTPSFHFRILEDFMPLYNEQSQVLVEKMKRLAHKEWIDIVPLITMCTLDIICETTMGVHINAQEISDSEYVKAIHEVGEMFIYRGLRPWLCMDAIFYLCPRGWQFRKNLNILHSFTRKVIKEKKELLLRQRMKSTLQKDIDHEQQNDFLKRRRRAFLELLLELHINDNAFSEEDIREEVDTFMFAGHDTTAMAISWALYNIGLHPHVQENIQIELESVFGGDLKRPVTSDDLKVMKYLDCVLKESLRLFPSVPFLARELNEDIQVLKYTVPKGAVCVIVPYILHRDPEVYSNPEVFDPDRFLPENCTGRHPYAYIPFSAGSRNCIGQRFAAMEEKTVVANILRNFTVNTLDERDKVNIVPDIILRNVDPLRIKLISRQ